MGTFFMSPRASPLFWSIYQWVTHTNSCSTFFLLLISHLLCCRTSCSRIFSFLLSRQTFVAVWKRAWPFIVFVCFHVCLTFLLPDGFSGPEPVKLFADWGTLRCLQGSVYASHWFREPWHRFPKKWEYFYAFTLLSHWNTSKISFKNHHQVQITPV